MRTSNYRISGKDPNAVSIAGRAPDWYKGREYKKLAPKYWIFKKYKEDGDEAFYTTHYYKEVLDKLDPKKVFAELGENAILLCWEEPGKFCHRRLVADWLRDNLHIQVFEYEMPHPWGLKCPKNNCQSSRITAYSSLFDENEIGCQCNKCDHTWNQKIPKIGMIDDKDKNKS